VWDRNEDQLFRHFTKCNLILAKRAQGRGLYGLHCCALNKSAGSLTPFFVVHGYNGGNLYCGMTVKGSVRRNSVEPVRAVL